jgi:hypothetical protein
VRPYIKKRKNKAKRIDNRAPEFNPPNIITSTQKKKKRIKRQELR